MKSPSKSISFSCDLGQFSSTHTHTPCTWCIWRRRYKRSYANSDLHLVRLSSVWKLNEAEVVCLICEVKILTRSARIATLHLVLNHLNGQIYHIYKRQVRRIQNTWSCIFKMHSSTDIIKRIHLFIGGAHAPKWGSRALGSRITYSNVSLLLLSVRLFV